MSILDWANPVKWFTSSVKVIGDTVVNVKSSFTGNRREQDEQQSKKFLMGLQAYSAEFAPRANRNWWDSLWDGLNRMPRPLIVIFIFWYFILAYLNPKEFQVLNVALDTVPENMWYIMSAVVSFYFVAREFQKSRDTKMALSDQEFSAVQKRMAILRDKDEELPAKSSGYKNPSVEAWKKKSGKASS